MKEHDRLVREFKVIIWGWGGGGRQATKRWDRFIGKVDPLETLCKDFDLASAEGIGWMKWLKNWAGKGFKFHAIIPKIYLFW